MTPTAHRSARALLRAAAGAPLLALLLAAGAAPPPAGAQHPNHAQGFRPESVFALGELDHTNLFNGGVTITIPIGPAYAITPEFSYSWTLSWTSNVWQWEEKPLGTSESFLQAEPRSASRTSAGFGWELSLAGRLLSEADPANTFLGPAYQSPDQALHELGHPGSSPNVVRSRNGTYLRHNKNQAKVESPDGAVRLFGPHGLTRMEDVHGNGLTVTYHAFDAQGDPREWRISDDHGREHKLLLARRQGRLVVTRVELERFATSTKAVYTFTYSDQSVPRPCNDPVVHSNCPGPGNQCGNTSNVLLPLLTRVELPDGSAYTMAAGNYRLNETGLCPDERRMLNGHLERMGLPTGGALEWDWRVWQFPQESRHLAVLERGGAIGHPFTRSVGLERRRHVRRNGQVLGEWLYTQTLVAEPTTLRRTESRTEVTDPLGHRSRHYFNVYADDLDEKTDEPPGYDRHEYGLGFTRRASDGTSPPRFLSREVFDKDGPHRRSVFVRYERDGDSPDNPRVASQRTVYHDDGGRRADLNRTQWDGLGHFRQEVATGNLPGSPTRTTFTSWNPAGAPANAAPWVLGTFDLQSVTEGGVTATREYHFNERGFLQRVRTRKGAACDGEDLLVERIEMQQSGILRREDFYGGDGAALACGALGSITLPAQPAYRQRHTHTCGVLSKTEWLVPGGGPLSFLPLDRTIDCRTGLVASARDPAGLQVSFSYDAMGRLTLEAPQAGQGASRHYFYTAQSGTSPAQILVEAKSGSTVLAEQRLFFDDFGRLAEERRKLPDGTFAVRKTDWSAQGFIDQRTEWEAQGDSQRSETRFRLYDPFGRPRQVTLPDGRVITLTYSGERNRTIRVPVATGISPGGEPVLTQASTTEVYDRFGRLVELFEPNGTKTAYAYDVLGNLAQVRVNDGASPVQSRFFGYDRRGLLSSETHPELGTSVVYSQYDALGNPRRIQRGGWDLAYSFDAASRLVEIRERGTTRIWKSWDYATANFQAGQWSRGKLREAVRHNRVLIPGTATELAVPVSEAYEYSGVGGRISKVTTTVGVGTHEDNDRPVFDYSLVYDPLGNVTSRTYPRCSHDFCSGSSANPLRTVTGVYSQGLLTAVPGHATSISYHPNGLIHQVAHANGVVETQERDADDMARPRRLSTSGATDDFDTGVYAFDGAGNVTKMGSHRFRYDPLSRIQEARVEIPGTGCGEELVLQNQIVSGTQTRQSCGTIRAGPAYTVAGTGDLTLTAGKRVALASGFSVASGGRLSVGTDPDLDPGGEPTPATQSYTFDRFGNLLTVTTTHQGQSPVTRTIGTSSTTNRLTVASYDLSGNVTAWAGQEYRYDPFNMLTQTKPTSGNGHTFLYGPGDERIWAIDWTQGTAPSNWRETWTLRDLDGSPLRQFQVTGGNTSTANYAFRRDYVRRGGALLAAHTPQGRRHFHLDHLGSPRMITDATGKTLAQHLYFPFGEEATNPGQNDEVLRFTAHERDDLDLTGTTRDLDYMRARYYSPHLGKFFSPDPLGESANVRVPQSWNRYSYVQNNPLKYIDPTGEVISLANLQDEDIVRLLEALNEFTGNTYGIDEDKNLVLLEVGKDSSATATEFLNDLIGSETTYTVMATEGRNRGLFDTKTVEINFQSFEGAKYGRVDPRTFNLGSTLVHELYHTSTGLYDTLDGTLGGTVRMKQDWTGPVVDFVNQMRSERGLPRRAAYVAERAGPYGRIPFDHVNPKRPERTYYVLRKRFD